MSHIQHIVVGRTSSRVLLAHTVPMTYARGWESLLLGVLSFLDGLLPMTQRARGSGLWKLEAIALVVGGQVRAPRVDFRSLAVLTLGGRPSAPLILQHFVTKATLV